jgi:hypothetical protein
VIAFRMRARVRTSFVCLIALVVPLPPLASAQAPGPAAAGLAGGWSGWAKLTNDWPGLACHYESAPDTDTVHLEINGDAGRLRGSLAIDIPAAAGSRCPPLRKRYAIEEVTETPGTVAFTDSGGNEWTLGVRRQGEVLQGLLAWRTGGPDQPLASGFTGPDGQRPLSRLSGEVRLHRTAPSGQAAPAATPGAGGAATGAPAASAPRTTSAGTYAKYGAMVLGANVVGLGLVYGANRVGKGSSSGGTVTCSPRVCQAGTPGQPCLCKPIGEPNKVTGGDCRSTDGGVPLGGVCNDTDQPCAAQLSCDLVPPDASYKCEDPTTGRCPI